MRIKIFTVVKNEVDIIKDWLDWHLRIVGEGNICIADNESNDGTYEILEKYGNLIKLDRVTGNFFLFKKRYTNRAIRKENRDSRSDLIVPLDADEFLSLYRDQLYCDREMIQKEFANLPLDTFGLFKLGLMTAQSYKEKYSDSLIEMTYFTRRTSKEWGKQAHSFCTTNTFQRVKSIGHHKISSSHKNQDYYFSDLCVVHFGVRGLNHYIQKSLAKRILLEDPRTISCVDSKFREETLSAYSTAEDLKKMYEEHAKANKYDFKSEAFANEIRKLRGTCISQ